MAGGRRRASVGSAASGKAAANKASARAAGSPAGKAAKTAKAAKPRTAAGALKKGAVKQKQQQQQQQQQQRSQKTKRERDAEALAAAAQDNASESGESIDEQPIVDHSEEEGSEVSANDEASGSEDDSDMEFVEEIVLGASDDDDGDDDDNSDIEADSDSDAESGSGSENGEGSDLMPALSKTRASTRKLPTKTSSSSANGERVLVGDEDIRAEGYVSSDEEHERNTIGNVPLHWYDEMDHIGYDKAGKKLMRKEGMDEVDKVLAAKDDPLYRRTVYDPKNDTTTVLTNRELVMVKRILEGKFPEVGFNAEQDYVDYFTSEQEVTPLSAAPEPKSRFIPSKWERMKVIKIANDIRAGRVAIGKKPPPKKPDFYLMWGEDDTVDDPVKRRKAPKHIPAPKVALPGHRESYHPPAEYLPTEEETKEWQEADPLDRRINYIPTDYKVMRHIPAYDSFVRERYERCLDLYLCPRFERNRLNIDPESLVPKLPSANELRPYPTTVGVTYFGHTGRVRALAISPTGELLASGGDDQIVRIWEVDTGRCLATYNVKRLLGLDPVPEPSEEALPDRAEDEPLEPAIVKLAWNPQPRYRVLAVGIADRVVLLHGGVSTACSPEDAEATASMLSGALVEEDDNSDDEDADAVKESDSELDEDVDEDELDDDTKRRRALKKSKGIAAWMEDGDFSPSAIAEGGFAKTSIVFKDASRGNILDLTWHAKGEYLVSVCDTQRVGSQVTIHHVRKRLSQQPITFRTNLRVQCVLFHPKKPILFVATKQQVSVYHLIKQTRMRRLKATTRWISSMALHSKGDNLVVGSYDRRVAWFDLDMSDSPWKTFRYHDRAVRRVDFHPRYPLMATCADDGVVHIFHARVFDDFAKDPFLVPVKVLKGHTTTTDGLGVLDCVFHPTQPWIFSAGADGRLQLYQNIP